MNENNVPDCLLPSDNDFGIPVLRLDMQAKFCSIPFVCHGEQKRTFQMNGTGTLHFYTDDYRFNALYDHPETILNHNPMNIVEPNYSIFNEMNLAFALQAIYKKRFIARLMQENGIRVFVDLNVANWAYEINKFGIPTGWSSFCTRGYEDRLEYLAYELQMAYEIAGNNPLLFVVYGGGDKVRKFCKEHGLVYVNSMISIKNKAVSNLRESIAKIDKNILKDLDARKLIPKTVELLKKGQVEDYANDEPISLLDKHDAIIPDGVIPSEEIVESEGVAQQELNFDFPF